jgi:hypothetical protein
MDTYYCSLTLVPFKSTQQKTTPMQSLFQTMKNTAILLPHYVILHYESSTVSRYYWARTSLDKSICYELINGPFRVSLQPSEDQI